MAKIEIAPEIQDAIAADIDAMDGKNKPKLATDEAPEPKMVPCDCTGGPGKDNLPGTGLISDTQLCPRCSGSGEVRS